MDRTGNKKFSAGLGLLMLGLIIWSSGSGFPDQSFPPAPDFRLIDLEGKTHTLSDYQGKILLINFWATWCPPCRAEIPDFVEVYASKKSQGLEILGVSVDNLAPSALKNFVSRLKINYPVALATEKIILDYQPGEYIPTTIVLDKKGRIRHKHVGQLDKETLLSIFDSLSQEK